MKTEVRMKSFVFGDGWRLDGLTGVAVEATGFEPARDIQLCAGRNEYASFQLAVEGGGPVEQIDVHAEECGGFECDIYVEWFHQSHGTLIPDLLVPYEAAHRAGFSKTAGKHYQSDYAAYWIDVFVPKAIAPGEYEFNVSVTARGVKSIHRVAIMVYKAELTDESMLIADMNNYADTLTRNFPSLAVNENRYIDGSYFACERSFYRISHEHRLVFHHLPYTHSGVNYLAFAPKLSGEGKDIRVSDWSLFDQHFGPYFDGSAFAGTKRGPIPVPYSYTPFNFDWPASYEKWGTEGFKVENRRILIDFIKHFEEKGWTRTAFEIFFNHKKRYRFFPYDGDEIRHQPDIEHIYAYDAIFSDLMNLSRVQTVFRVDSSWSYGLHYHSDLSKIIKMWTVGSGILWKYPESFMYMKKQDNILWMYGGIPGIGEDLYKLYEWPMRCLQNDFAGFLYWNTTGIGKDFLTCPSGDGSTTIYYPGHPFGLDEALPSVRMKYLRNAMQTADLIKMHEGTNTFTTMREVIDELYGVARNEWYDELPDSWKVPPHELTNDILGSAPGNHPSRNATPALPAKVKEKMLEIASSHTGGKSRWA